jgi:AcrR family transcriptional regulator
MKNAPKNSEQDTQLKIVEIAERLFGQIGFQKTTVADIARALRMSSANIYRFFSAKAEIDEAVGRRILREVEAAVDNTAKHFGSASYKLRESMVAIERIHSQRFAANPKLHELVETALNENWPIAREHTEKIEKSLTEIISQGNRDGEWHADDDDLAAMLVRSACLRFCHPRLMVECFAEPEPTIDQMVDFCLAALVEGSSTRDDRTLACREEAGRLAN